MREITIQRRHGLSAGRLRHAQVMRISILLLQLLCLPPMAAVWADKEKAVYVEKHTETSDHHNLRVATSSSMGYLDSFTSALYTLLNTVGLHNAEPSPSGIDVGEGGPSSSSSLRDIDSPSGREGGSQGWRDGNESSREGRRLANKKKLNMKRQQATGSRTANMQWYVDWINAQCVQSCDPRTTTNPNCAGLALRENFLFDSAMICCKTMIPWKSYDTCTRVGSPDGTLNQVYQDINTPVNNWGNVMPVNNAKPPMNTAQQPVGKLPTTMKDPTPAKQQILPKSTCWRSGMECVSEAAKFACCGVCSNGVCI